ncbi:hypothetical protein TrVFT333_000802 [Trichoderma virens FT-333]|nr:hypothetical protein TrVFT333_000802 [Trichoderma virens FT-333]
MSLPATINAIQIESQGKAVIKEVPLPKLREDYLLVRTTAVAVNPIDWKFIDFDQGLAGTTVGCDYAGVVEATGPQLTKPFKKGDRIAGFAHGANKVQPENGTFGEYIVVKAGVAFKIPGTISDEEAASLGLGIATVAQGLYRSLKLPLPAKPISESATILIYGGATATGILGIQYAKLSGFTVVTTCSPKTSHAERCIADIREFTQGQLRLAWDCVATPATASICARALSTNEKSDYSSLLHINPKDIMAINSNINVRTSVAWMCLGERTEEFGAVSEANHKEYGFATAFFDLSRELLADGKLKPARQSVNATGGGLVGVLKGIEECRCGNCDLHPEACGQCRRARLQCHGYRDLRDLAFRDETISTEQKVVARRTLTQEPYPASMDLGWNIRARYTFFSSYVFGFAQSLGPLIRFNSNSSTHDHISASLEAVSLAFTAVQLHNPVLLNIAREAYVTAIQRLSHTIDVLSSSVVEETLQSILLLDMYEKMVNPYHQDKPSWMSHAQGGMSLLNSHTQQLSSSSSGCELAGRLSTAVIVSCGALAIPVPPALMTLRQQFDPIITSVKWGFQGLLACVVELQADLRNAGGQCTVDLAERAEQLDTQLVNLQNKLPRSWQPQQISPVRPNPLIFNTHYEIYPDHYITQVTNGIRVARLMLHAILKDSPISLSNFNIHRSIMIRIRDITSQICASIPQFILPGVRASNTVPFSLLQSLQCRILLAPLYITNQISCDASMQDWLQRCLKYMAEMGGMRAAKDVAEMMRTKPKLEYWFVYALVGSYAFAA